MQELTLDIEVLPSVDAAGEWAMRAILALRAQDARSATSAYRRALAAPGHHPDTLSNLAAFALMAGNSSEACRHAEAALVAAPGHGGACNNLAVAQLGLGRTELALATLERAVATPVPSIKAMANLGYLLNLRLEYAQAATWLDRALAATPQSRRLHLERAQVARHQGQVTLARQHALQALALQARALPARLVPPAAKVGKALGRQGAGILLDARDVLTANGQSFHLIAGTLLALVRDGELLPNDKDVDLAVPFDCDRQQLLAGFERDPRFRVPAPPPGVSLETVWAVGVIHQATGIGVDLFFAKPEGERVRFGLGAPPTILFSAVRPYRLGSLRWQEHDWPVPDVPERYLEDIYGPHWRTPDPHFDTVLSNPCRAPESLPLAIVMGLLRLAAALGAGDWRRAHALCAQILAREPIPVVAELASLLVTRCPGLQEASLA